MSIGSSLKNVFFIEKHACYLAKNRYNGSKRTGISKCPGQEEKTVPQTYYGISETELGKGAKLPLKVLGESGEVFYELALEMVREIRRNNQAGKGTVLICPVGPVGHYPIFARLVNRERLSLKDCCFINMDEYLTDAREYIPMESPLSFRGFMAREVYGKIDEDLLMPLSRRVFPDPARPGAIRELIDSLGGVDLALGGIGINGHLAFNEPQPGCSAAEFARLPARVLAISPETRTANAIGDLGGALEEMPRYCVTLGMAEILGARRVRLGVFRDWHRAVVRRAAYGEISAAFPVTLLQAHPDACVYVNANAAKKPW